MRKPWTLTQVFFATAVFLVAMLWLQFYQVYQGSEVAIRESSDRQRALSSQRIADAVAAYLNQADASVTDLNNELDTKAIDVSDFDAIEAALFSDLINHDSLTEVSFTYAWDDGFDADGTMKLLPGRRGQITVAREQSGAIVTRRVIFAGGSFQTQARQREPGAFFKGAPLLTINHQTPDPTSDPTFITPTNRSFYGHALWSDLHWSELDDALPAPQRRVEVTVQKAISNARGGFLGVVRVGILTQRLDDIQRLSLPMGDPHQVFLCDKQGRLITRLSKADTVEVVGDDLRIQSRSLPQGVEKALQLPILAQVSKGEPKGDRFLAGGETWLASFQSLPNTQDWLVGVVVPESFYLGGLQEARVRMLVVSILIGYLLVLCGILSLRVMRKGLQQVTSETDRIGRFDFSAESHPPSLAEVNRAMDSLESAKTALRAMGKYVPVDLVRQLYETQSDPVLGGCPRELSILFTDIKDFTTLSEQLKAQDLATLLGLYLKAMTDAVYANGGTIDKFIGDAIMALWNAPTLSAQHQLQACRAAVACISATRSLFESPAWQGRPVWQTRFGLNCDVVNVGHFGAPERMSYTAIGDGVNLASRLEGLNKQYGTTILVSETIYAAARTEFSFRLLDRVAVKGKKQGIQVYQLIVDPIDTDVLERYQQALDLYFNRDFKAAAALLEQQPQDGPSGTLLRRCAQLTQSPPGPDWDGVYVSAVK